MKNIVALTLLCCLIIGFAVGCQSRPPQQLGDVPAPATEAAKTEQASPSPDSPLSTLTPLKIGSPEPAAPAASPTVAATETKNTGGDKQVGKLIAIIKTDKGDIKAELYPDVAPNTVLNFVTLAKKGFYDNLNFHRVEPGFCIQGGDPKGDGTGGPGYCIPAEFNDRKHVLGTLAMARAQNPDSAGSQFYVTLGTHPFLDKNYTVFGQVTEGLSTCQNIAVGDKIKSITIEGELPPSLQGKEVQKSNYMK